MSMPDYFRRDFIERTMDNYRDIKKRCNRENGPFEVTQLFNSFLMAFIHPKEQWFDEIDPTPLPADGWPEVNTATPYKSNAPKNVKQLVRMIRNALAHGNIDVLPNTHQVDKAARDIGLVTLWNTPTGSTEKTWETTISIDTLERLLHAFVPVALKLADKHRP